MKLDHVTRTGRRYPFLPWGWDGGRPWVTVHRRTRHAVPVRFVRGRRP